MHCYIVLYIYIYIYVYYVRPDLLRFEHPVCFLSPHFSFIQE